MTHTITIGPQVDDRPGWTDVVLATDGQDRASACGILAMRLRIGAAVLRVDGIGGVETHEGFRRRGLARYVLDAAIEHMSAGDAALTMLYGIVDFYPKFGYVTAGPDYRLVLPVSERVAEVPIGWTVRGFVPTDLPNLQTLYATATVDASWACVRDATAYPWDRLLAVAPAERDHECRVVVDDRGVLRGYAWRGRGCGFVDGYGTDDRTQLIMSDVVAADQRAADVLLDACQDWGGRRRRRGPARHTHTSG